MGTFILWVAKRLGVTALLSSIIVYGAMALTATGGIWLMKHRYDAGKIEVGYKKCTAEADQLAEENRRKADRLNAEREAARLKTEAALRRKIAALYALKADACSEADALPGLLEGIPSAP